MSRSASAAIVGAVFLSAALGTAQEADGPLRTDVKRLTADVRFLASDDLAGRGNGTPGLERAAEYIAAEFRKAGLAPGGADGTYFQPFEITTRLEPDARSPLVLRGADGETHFRLGAHFYPVSVIDRTAESAEPPPEDSMPVAFAGYGIAAPELGYDDYAGLDVRGGAVVVFTHEPQEDEAGSRFGGRALTPHAEIERKARVARERGARMLVVVEDPSHVVDRAVTPGWTNDPRIGELGMPVVRVERARLARALPGVDLAAEARAIDLHLAPRSRMVPQATIVYAEQLARVRARVRNVVGVLPGGSPELSREAVVVGAHYDHVGFGGARSLSPYATGEIHNGADDNGSGSAAVMEMARAASASRARFARTIVFVAFAAEEIGLLGSRHYVGQPAVPLARTVAMLNLDMVGRPLGRVLIGGRERAPRFKGVIEAVRRRTRLRIDDFRNGGYSEGASDDASFVRAGVPALAFFTGFHGDYHRPGDDWQRLDAEGTAEVARVALLVLERLAR